MHTPAPIQSKTVWIQHLNFNNQHRDNRITKMKRKKKQQRRTKWSCGVHLQLKNAFSFEISMQIIRPTRKMCLLTSSIWFAVAVQWNKYNSRTAQKNKLTYLVAICRIELFRFAADSIHTKFGCWLFRVFCCCWLIGWLVVFVFYYFSVFTTFTMPFNKLAVAFLHTLLSILPSQISCIYGKYLPLIVFVTVIQTKKRVIFIQTEGGKKKKEFFLLNKICNLEWNEKTEKSMIDNFVQLNFNEWKKLAFFRCRSMSRSPSDREYLSI